VAVVFRKKASYSVQGINFHFSFGIRGIGLGLTRESLEALYDRGPNPGKAKKCFSNETSSNFSTSSTFLSPLSFNLKIKESRRRGGEGWGAF